MSKLLFVLLIFLIIPLIVITLRYRKLYRIYKYTDVATHLGNGLLFQSTLMAEIKKMDSSNSLALVIIDLDNFGEVNKCYGFNIADNVIKEIAALIVTHVDIKNVFRQYSKGDEFLIILRDNQENIYGVVEKIRQDIEFNTFSQYKIKITASCGIAYCQVGIDDFNSLISKVMQVWMDSKSGKKNSIIVK